MTSEVESIRPSQVVLGGFPPHLVVALHGILTGDTEPDWSDSLAGWLQEQSARYTVITAEYFELPLPRVAAIRNRSRSRSLIHRIDARAREIQRTFGTAPLISILGHSNGGVLADQVIEGVIGKGWQIHGVLFMAAAVRAKRQTQRCVSWIRTGALEKAGLVIASRDRLLGAMRWDPVAIVAWPWGALGREGWVEAEIPAAYSPHFTTVSLPSSHSAFLSWEQRYETFREIIAPFLGWDETQEGRAV